jgi:hypothetical protein
LFFFFFFDFWKKKFISIFIAFTLKREKKIRLECAHENENKNLIIIIMIMVMVEVVSIWWLVAVGVGLWMIFYVFLWIFLIYNFFFGEKTVVEMSRLRFLSVVILVWIGWWLTLFLLCPTGSFKPFKFVLLLIFLFSTLITVATHYGWFMEIRQSTMYAKKC